MENTERAMDGVEIVGTFPVKRFFDTLAMLLSNKYEMELTVKATRIAKDAPPARDERAARPAKGQ